MSECKWKGEESIHIPSDSIETQIIFSFATMLSQAIP